MSGKTLGRGLAALLGDIDEAQAASGGVSHLETHLLIPNKDQPRRHFDKDALQDLTASVREKGVLQPLLVRPIVEDGFNMYQIIAGERRWRASKEAGLSQLPVVVIDCDDLEALEIGLIENLQRENLNVLEEAESLWRLLQDHKKTQDEVAKAVGKSRSYVANMIRLIALPEEVKHYVRTGRMSAGHARALLNTQNPLEMAQSIIEKNLSVRDAEHEARKQKKQGAGAAQGNAPMYDASQSQEHSDADIIAQKIAQSLGVPVTLKVSAKEAVLSIRFQSWQQLDELCKLVQSQPEA